MKRILYPMAIAGLLTAASCNDTPKADKAEAGAAVSIDSNTRKGAAYKADPTQSKIEFIGAKPGKNHHGTIAMTDGTLMAENGALSGGKFTLDMKSLKADDQDAEGNTKLTGHLQNSDFFDVENHPTATFEISSVTAGTDTTGGNKVMMPGATHTITGNLTMRGVTKSISFPAKVAVSDNNVTADADFNIDRTQWEVGTVSTLDKSLIAKDVNIKLHIVANK